MRRWEEAASVLGLLRTRIAESKLLLAAVLTMSGNADAADRAATEYRELLKENGRRSLSRNELLARFPFQKAADIAFVGDVLYAVGEQAFNGHADRDMV